MEMWKQKDELHMPAMQAMMELSKEPQNIADFMQEKRNLFHTLPEE
jgi:hypothetical protein